MNDLVACGKVRAPIVIGGTISTVVRSHRPTRNRVHEDTSDAVADWPILNALLNTASALPGFLPRRRGVGVGYSMHAAR